jgi:cadmium resistance protein CadD (predicted permease)
LELARLGQAAAMFTVTNIDGMVVLVVFFGRAHGERSGFARVIIGQYIGFAAILGISVLGALGASLLPRSAIPFLGVLPLSLGIRLAWDAWRSRGPDTEDGGMVGNGNVGIVEMAAVTVANGGDNISVYVPVFAVVGASGMLGYCVAFLIGLAIWCTAGLFIATRPAIATVLTRWGHLIVPAVLIGIGLVILIGGGAFRL